MKRNNNQFNFLGANNEQIDEFNAFGGNDNFKQRRNYKFDKSINRNQIMNNKNGIDEIKLNNNKSKFTLKNSPNNDRIIKHSLSFMVKPSLINTNSEQFINKESKEISKKTNRNNNILKSTKNLKHKEKKHNKLTINKQNKISDKNEGSENNYKHLNTINNSNNQNFYNTINNFEEKTINSLDQHSNIFKSINIFSSILIILNNINEINRFLEKEKNIIKIEEINNNNKLNLSNILLIINKYIWQNNYPEDYFIKKYNDYLKYVMAKYNIKEDKYFYDIKNIGLIVNYIYSEINKEFTNLKNNGIKSEEFQGNDALSIFKNEFIKNYNSIISDNFIVINETKSKCENCKANYLSYNKKYKPIYKYFPFFYFYFDLDEIYNYYMMTNQISQINGIQNINLEQCFEYYFIEKIKYLKNNCLYCESCNQLVNFEYNIFSLPNIITISLSNNGKANFILQNQIDLNKYAKKSDNNSYYLISALCKNTFTNHFHLYCYNYRKESWNCYHSNYTEECKTIDKNDSPFLLVYQIINSMDFLYNSLNIDNDSKISLFVHLPNGMGTKLLYFNKNYTIKRVIEKLSNYYNLPKDRMILLINAEKLKENDILSNKAKNGNRMNVLMKNN